jgi:ligand-binding sensor domain-containing protein/serine phosphatase RsbU (regulator of sigma subunit)
MKSHLIRFIVFSLAFFWGGRDMTGQQYHFRHYGIPEGLPNSFIYSIREDDRGFLWIGTGTELVSFNGRVFKKAPLADTLGQGFVTVTFRDDNGSLWFGFSNGYVGKLDQGVFRFFDLPRFTKSRINGIVALPDGNLVIASQTGGLFLIIPGAEEAIRKIDDQFQQISSLAYVKDRLLIGTFEGLYTAELDNETDTLQTVKKIEAIPDVKIQALCPADEEVLVGTQGKGVWWLKPGERTTAGLHPSFKEREGMNVTNLFMDSKGRLWVSTMGDGLFRVSHDGQVEHLNEKGLKSRNVQCVFEDFEHNIWIGTYGQGMVFFPEESVVFFSFPSPVPGNNITAVASQGDRFVVAGEGGLMIKPCRGKGESRYYSSRQGLPRTAITAIYVDGQDRVWLGTGGEGIFRLQGGRIVPVFRSGNILENTINTLRGDEKNIWAGTASGVLLFDTEGHLIRKYSTNEGLPYNNINDIYLDPQHRAWLATMADGLYVIEGDSIHRHYRFPSMIARTQMKSITLDPSDNVWIGSYGSGVIEILPDTFYNYLDKSGLVSNYCYSMAADRSGGIWIGHSMGVSRIYPDKMKVRTYAKKHGITAECNTNAVCVDPMGMVWFGTTSGVIRFDPAHDVSDTIPPKTNILSITFSDKKIPVGKKIIMPYGHYRVRIRFVGISFKDPQEVTYQYKLENYDEKWSEITANDFAYYPRLEDGKYTFLLKAYNSSGYSIDEPLAVRIIIKKPFWKTWWFYVLVFLVVLGGFYAYLKARERKHIRLEQYLKTELEKRTKEVIEKKEELEIKNKEITDSINYARRIQGNILPPLRKLREVFPESFVFYAPRDIVSGDFYWWGPVDDDRFLVVCADSTGHGVPGAFMSMIGSTLIKDLTNQGRYESPSQLLRFLDREIVMSLNQDREGKSNDGMDITVLEVDPKNFHIKFASAMRPVILFIDNELFYIRGNRSGVGGEFTGDKIFDDQEYDLKAGDAIYLFSDGYPDQFGGPKGKKMKVERVKKMLEEIHLLPMEEQYNIVKNYFFDWKGDSFQVDDVLFMGLRL